MFHAKAQSSRKGAKKAGILLSFAPLRLCAKQADLNFGPIFIKISFQFLPAEIRNMNKNRSLFAFLFVAAVLALAAVSPFLTRSKAQSVADSFGVEDLGRTQVGGSRTGHQAITASTPVASASPTRFTVRPVAVTPAARLRSNASVPSFEPTG